MRILTRYLLSQFLRIFAVCVLGVPLLFIVIDLTDNLDIYLADQNATNFEVALHYLYQFPYQSLVGFPIAALLAGVFTISNMTRHHETTAAKAGGMSFYRLVAPLMLGALLLSGVALALTEIVPNTNRKAEEVLGQRQSRSRTLRMSFLFRGNLGRVYSIGRLDLRDGSMSDLQIAREGTGPEYPTYNVSAETARYDSAGGVWVAEQGWLRMFPDTESSVEMQFDELWQIAFRETPEELLAQPKRPEEMQYEEMGRFIEAIERSGGTANNLNTERALRLSFPFAVFIIVLFGTPLAHSNKRGGAPRSIGIALATTVLFLIIVRISQALGAGGVVSPTLGAWIPNLLFLGAGLVLMVRVRT